MSANNTTMLIDGNSIILGNIHNSQMLTLHGDTIEGIPESDAQWMIEKGQPDGYAPLDGFSQVPLVNLPPVELTTNKGQPNGYASLGSDGKVPISEIPALVIHDVFVVNTYPDLASLTSAQVGDVGIVTSDAQPQLRGSYILVQDPPTLLVNWYRVTSSTLVSSVNGVTGPTVVLAASDITTGTLPVGQLPVLQATGDATGISTSGTGSIPLTLQSTGVTPGFYTRPVIQIDSKGRIIDALNAPSILYRQASTIDPSGDIIYRIGNSDESSSLDVSNGCDIVAPDVNITTNATNISGVTTLTGTTVFASPGTIVAQALTEEIVTTSHVTMNESGIMAHKRYVIGSATTNASGLWSFTHNLGVVPTHYTATSLNNSAAITGQNIVSFNTVTTTTITGRVMQPIAVVLGGNPVQFVTGATVRVYCSLD